MTFVLGKKEILHEHRMEVLIDGLINGVLS